MVRHDETEVVVDLEDAGDKAQVLDCIDNTDAAADSIVDAEEEDHYAQEDLV